MRHAYLAFSRCHDPNSDGVVVRTGGDEGAVLIHSDHADPLSVASQSLDAVSTHTNLGLVSQKVSLHQEALKSHRLITASGLATISVGLSPR